MKLDTASLAELWMGTVQGSLLLAKASQDPAVIGRNLAHFKKYVETLLCGSSDNTYSPTHPLT